MKKWQIEKFFRRRLKCDKKYVGQTTGSIRVRARVPYWVEYVEELQRRQTFF